MTQDGDPSPHSRPDLALADFTEISRIHHAEQPPPPPAALTTTPEPQPAANTAPYNDPGPPRAPPSPILIHPDPDRGPFVPPARARGHEAASSPNSDGFNLAAESLSPRLATHLASHFSSHLPSHHALQAVLVASGFRRIVVFASLNAEGRDDDVAALEGEVRREVAVHGTYCGIRDPQWRLKLGQRRTLEFSVNAAKEIANASAATEEADEAVEVLARAARKRARNHAVQEIRGGDDVASLLPSPARRPRPAGSPVAPQVLARASRKRVRESAAEKKAEAARSPTSPPSPPQRTRPESSRTARRRLTGDSVQGTERRDDGVRAVAPVAHRSLLGGGGEVKAEDREDSPFDDFVTRDALVTAVRIYMEAQKVPLVAGRDYSIVFSEHRGGSSARKGMTASVVCKCGTPIKLWYSQRSKSFKMSNFLRHIKLMNCGDAKKEGFALRPELDSE